MRNSPIRILNVHAGEAYGALPYVRGKVGSKPTRLLIDTGAACTLIHYSTLGERERQEVIPSYRNITGVTGDNLEVIGESDVSITINGREVLHNCVVVKNMRQDAIIGYDLLSEEGFVLDFSKAWKDKPERKEKSYLRLPKETEMKPRTYQVFEVSPARRLDRCLEARVRPQKIAESGVWVMDSVTSINKEGKVTVLPKEGFPLALSFWQGNHGHLQWVAQKAT